MNAGLPLSIINIFSNYVKAVFDDCQFGILESGEGSPPIPEMNLQRSAQLIRASLNSVRLLININTVCLIIKD